MTHLCILYPWKYKLEYVYNTGSPQIYGLFLKVCTVHVSVSARPLFPGGSVLDSVNKVIKSEFWIEFEDPALRVEI